MIDLPEFEALESGHGAYEVAFATPVKGYTRAEAEAIVVKLNALVAAYKKTAL